MSSAFDPFVLFVSFVVKQFCTSARGISFFSRPFVTLTQATKIAKGYSSTSLLFLVCPALRFSGPVFRCSLRLGERLIS